MAGHSARSMSEQYYKRLRSERKELQLAFLTAGQYVPARLVVDGFNDVLRLFRGWKKIHCREVNPNERLSAFQDRPYITTVESNLIRFLHNFRTTIISTFGFLHLPVRLQSQTRVLISVFLLTEVPFGGQHGLSTARLWKLNLSSIKMNKVSKLLT